MIKKALTIAGSDSGGGAGIQTDLKTFENIGVFGMSAITAITAQNTLGVTAVHYLPTQMVAAQLDAVLSDIGTDAVKTGMLGNAEIAAVVAEKLREYRLEKVVVDPVMVATSGDLLLEERAVDVVKEKLLPLAFIVTPNKYEAEILAGMKIAGPADAREAARRLHGMGAKGVLLKGGHFQGNSAVDLYYDGQAFHELAKPKVETRNQHGTGCTLAAAIAAYLCFDLPPLTAIAKAKDYVWQRLQYASRHQVGAGSGPICLPFPPKETP
ncbi:MAG TPA: bifunctional hydroxymethylpyrimidine kinase/phosphomethylpyrimidine kinase [Clostridia bacterium]|nr:bifunctional hydroxymethylpyrimidine kinase/phosphomethylpyrimidine kinase [Clostridia bacterium]